jgi:hypothetical protein
VKSGQFKATMVADLHLGIASLSWREGKGRRSIHPLFSFSMCGTRYNRIVLVLCGLLWFVVNCCLGYPEGTYLPLNENRRGKDINEKRSFTQLVDKIYKKGGTVRFVVAFSTGHVGTTTLSDKRTYNSKDVKAANLHFVFEKGGVPPSTCSSPSWNLQSEIEHVEHYYGPAVLDYELFDKNFTVIDLSHSNLCFYRGLIWVLRKSQVPFEFVRIRRERLETVISMSVQNGTFIDFFKNDYYRFEPFSQISQVHLPIPGHRETWEGMVRAQHVLWVIDETQARWESLIAHFPDLPYAEIYWSKMDDNFTAAVSQIAKILGVKPADSAPMVKKVHAGSASKDEDMRARLRRLDLKYRAIMEFNESAIELTGFHGEHWLYANQNRKYLFCSNVNTANVGSVVAGIERKAANS